MSEDVDPLDAALNQMIRDAIRRQQAEGKAMTVWIDFTILDAKDQPKLWVRPMDEDGPTSTAEPVLSWEVNATEPTWHIHEHEEHEHGTEAT